MALFPALVKPRMSSSDLSSLRLRFLIPDCGDPGCPVHGSKTGNNYKAGETVTFTCDAGYHLEGSTTLLCLENGNWDNTIPKCKKRNSAFYVLNCCK